MPTRGVALDPYMSKDAVAPVAGLGERVAALWRETLSLVPGLAFEIFQSSDTNAMSGNGNSAAYTDMVSQGTMTIVDGGWISFFDLLKLAYRHKSAMPIYVTSLQRTAVPAAGASDVLTREAMGSGVFRQTHGEVSTCFRLTEFRGRQIYPPNVYLCLCRTPSTL